MDVRLVPSARVSAGALVVLLAALLVGAGCGSGPDGPTGPGSGQPSATAAHEAGTTTDAPRHDFFHEGHPYRLQNSVRGLRRAVELGYEWIDIDSNYCRAGEGPVPLVPLATHWQRIRGDHFRDPAGRVPDDARWSDLTLAEARRLRTDDPEPYRVLTMVEIVRAAARTGLRGIEWEVKGGAGFEEPAPYREVLAAAEEAGVEIIVKTLRNVGGEAAALRRLAAAKRAGATTMLLNRVGGPVRIDADRASYVDHVRGEWVRTS